MNCGKTWRTILTSAVLVALLSGCAKKNSVTLAPTTPAQEGPVQSFIGGPAAAAQGAIRRGAEIQKAKEHLNAIKQLIVAYNTDRGRDPTNMKEFAEYIQRDAAQTAKYLQEGTLTMVFKRDLAPEALLAYVSFEDGAGNRLVLRKNGAIEVLNTQAFDQAKKL